MFFCLSKVIKVSHGYSYNYGRISYVTITVVKWSIIRALQVIIFYVAGLK